MRRKKKGKQLPTPSTVDQSRATAPLRPAQDANTPRERSLTMQDVASAFATTARGREVFGSIVVGLHAAAQAVQDERGADEPAKGKKAARGKQKRKGGK